MKPLILYFKKYPSFLKHLPETEKKTQPQTLTFLPEAFFLPFVYRILKHGGVNLSKTACIWNIWWITVSNYRNRETNLQSQGKLDKFHIFWSEMQLMQLELVY